MDRDLRNLNPEEYALLKDAAAYIVILIAGADGNIDATEIEWAEKIVHIRTYTGDERLKDFHQELDEELPNKIKQFIAELPKDVNKRSQIVSDKLSGLNSILASLHPAIGAYLYKSFVTYARRIATSSGGFLGFMTVSAEEKKWVGLPMLTPITYHSEEEE